MADWREEALHPRSGGSYTARGGTALLGTDWETWAFVGLEGGEVKGLVGVEILIEALPPDQRAALEQHLRVPLERFRKEGDNLPSLLRDAVRQTLKARTYLPVSVQRLPSVEVFYQEHEPSPWTLNVSPSDTLTRLTVPCKEYRWDRFGMEKRVGYCAPRREWLAFNYPTAREIWEIQHPDE
jgi:hypothetical protein